MLTNDDLDHIREVSFHQPGATYFNNDVIRPLLEWIDFQAGLISDLKAESSAFDVGVAEGEKKVISELVYYADGYGDLENVVTRAMYTFIKSYLSAKRDTVQK